MVVNAVVQTITSEDHQITVLNQRDIILLTLGLVNQPLTTQEAYTLTKNLVDRLSSYVLFPLPGSEIFQQLVQKYIRKGMIRSHYSLIRKKHVIQLTDHGEGSADYIIDSLINRETAHIIDEFQDLIDLFF
ncbi:MAG: hypothetical protein ACXAE3_05325 [Candidatus Kariarchaeaceae archaeon]|jgi:hypothetical protein